MLVITTEVMIFWKFVSPRSGMFKWVKIKYKVFEKRSWKGARCLVWFDFVCFSSSAGLSKLKASQGGDVYYLVTEGFLNLSVNLLCKLLVQHFWTKIFISFESHLLFLSFLKFKTLPCLYAALCPILQTKYLHVDIMLWIGEAECVLAFLSLLK